MTHTLITLPEIDSTNNYLKTFREKEEHDIVLVTTPYQTAGRGQRENTWESERGKNLLLSLLIHPRCVKPSHLFAISEMIALAVCHTLNQYYPGFRVKWPNDIYHGEQKVAGILIETDLMGGCVENAIIGMGINLNQETFHSDAPNPLSLCHLTGHPLPCTEVLTTLIQQIDHYYTRLRQGEWEGLHQAYKALLYRGKGYHPYRDEHGRFEAQLYDIEPSGHLLLLDTQQRKRRYAFKEVVFLHDSPASE